MKYTEKFFEFPIRIYDRFSVRKAEDQEERDDAPYEGEWREGLQRLSYREIMGWSDFFDSDQGPEGVDKDGYYFTLISTLTQGIFICTWNKKKFEKEFNIHIEKYEEQIGEDINQQLNDIENEV